MTPDISRLAELIEQEKIIAAIDEVIEIDTKK